MKLVQEHINEKFTEDSDPIHDMGIGIIKKLEPFLILKQNNVYFLPHELDMLKEYFGNDLSKIYLLSHPYYKGDKLNDFDIFCEKAIPKIISKLKMYERKSLHGYFYDLYETPIGKICNLFFPEQKERYFLSDLEAAINLYGQYLS